VLSGKQPLCSNSMSSMTRQLACAKHLILEQYNLCRHALSHMMCMGQKEMLYLLETLCTNLSVPSLSC
jgi:hypothetical protein